MEEKKVMNVAELAKTLGISRSLAYSLISNKIIPYIRIGKRIVIPKDTFSSWIEANTNMTGREKEE